MASDWPNLASGQIAPPTKNGHAPPPTESRKSYQSVNPFRVRAGFSFATILPPEPKDSWFPARCPAGHGNNANRIAGRHRLRSELRRCLVRGNGPERLGGEEHNSTPSCSIFGSPSLQRFLIKYFTSNPAAKALCWPMLAAVYIFSHYSFLHLEANI
ncbi:unnamed protein product [Leuciscus chuanchicus]